VIVVIANGEWYLSKGIRPPMSLMFLIEGLILFSFVIFPFVIGSMLRKAGRPSGAAGQDS